MSSTLNLKFCPKCGERLSYTSFEGYCAIADCLWNNEECTSPGHQDQSARLAASAEVDQVGGTIYQPISEFLNWLYADLQRLDEALANSGQSHHPDTDLLQHADSLAALRVYSRFVKARLEQRA